MTKDDLISNKGEAYEYNHRTIVTPVQEAYLAMDIWAKQVAIGFGNFLDNDFISLGGGKFIRFVKDGEGDGIEYTTEQVYEIYLVEQVLLKEGENDVPDGVGGNYSK